MRTCEIEGCGKRHNSHGLCKMHLMRVQRHNDPTVVKKGGGRISDRTCEIGGCEAKHYARGLCGAHYVQMWRADTKTSENALCDLSDCGEPAVSYGLCERHDAEAVDAPFWNPPRPKAKLPIVDWERLGEKTREHVSWTDTALTRGEILAARGMSQTEYDDLPIKDPQTLYFITS